MKRTASLLALALAACSGEEGRSGALCTVTQEDDALVLRCPDGSSATLPGSCEETTDASGNRMIRCPDGTEAVIRPGETVADGQLVGRVVLVPMGRPAVGATVQVLGTDRSGTTAADGSFRIEGIPAGVWKVRVSYDRWQAVEMELPLFAGTWNAGTIELDAEEDLRLQSRSQVNVERELVVDFDSRGFEVVSLADGSVQRVDVPVSEAFWLGADVIFLRQRGGSLVGFWWPDTEELFWLDENTNFYLHAEGFLLIHQVDDSRQELSLLKGATKVPLGVVSRAWFDIDQRWSVFFVAADEGLFVVDASESTPQMRQLDERRPDSLISDPELVWARFGDERVLIDLDDGNRIPVNGSVDPYNGFASWNDDTGTHTYDARTNYQRFVPDVIAAGWGGSEPRWFLYRSSDGRWMAEPRGEGTAVELGGQPISFSPNGSRAVLLEGSSFVLRDMDGGATWTIALEGVDLSYAEWHGWIDDDWFLFRAEGTLYLGKGDGTWIAIGRTRSLTGWRRQGDMLLLLDDGALTLWDLSTGTGRSLGWGWSANLSPDGDWVFWISDHGRLVSYEVATGEKHLLAENVESYLPLRSGVVIVGNWTYAPERFVRYP